MPAPPWMEGRNKVSQLIGAAPGGAKKQDTGGRRGRRWKVRREGRPQNDLRGRTQPRDGGALDKDTGGGKYGPLWRLRLSVCSSPLHAVVVRTGSVVGRTDGRTKEIVSGVERAFLFDCRRLIARALVRAVAWGGKNRDCYTSVQNSQVGLLPHKDLILQRLEM